MDVRQGFIDSIGNTPLIRLKKASELTECDIYGKAEFLNPGGSVKDRAALAIVTAAEARGDLKPGRSEEHTSELQSKAYLVCRLLLEKTNTHTHTYHT